MQAQKSISDSIFQLDAVEVSGRPFLSPDRTDKIVTISADELGPFTGQTVAAALQALSGVAVRQYGAAGIGTASFRGGSSAQTAVLWNGFPISNPMLAQTDLSLLSLSQFDQVTLHFGSGSALWGSGAVGGTIALQNAPSFRKPSTFTLQTGVGAYGQVLQAFSWEQGKENWAVQSHVFHRAAQNNYTYEDAFGEVKELEHADTRQYGLQFSPKARWGAHEISFHSWWQKAYRNLPPSRVQSFSVAEQDDEQLRLALAYAYSQADWTLHFRVARMGDRIVYRDSLLGLATNNRATHWWSEVAVLKSWDSGHQVELLGQWNRQTGLSESYGTQSSGRTNYSGVLRYNWRLRDDWLFSARLRQEISDGKALPIMPYLGFFTKWNKAIQLRGNVSRSFRQPGLDDLFLKPGGNPDLRPETGWAQEVGVDLMLFPHMNYSTTFFNRQMEDWIQWVPGDGFWRPQNVRTVNSSGLEQEITWAKIAHSGKQQARLFYHWIRSIDRSNDPEINGRQIIYVPQHQVGLQLLWTKAPWFVQGTYQWNSRRFTTRDHSSSLPAFHLGQVGAGWRNNWESWSVELQLNVHNLWNTRYELAVNRPMPGRTFELQGIFTWRGKDSFLSEKIN